jgi:CubicO group peptidase (beta-lactamase class C family)
MKIKNLLSHSSGIPDFERHNLPTNISNSEVFERLSKEKIYEIVYSYNQTNYMMLAMIIERISGQKFEDFV